MSTNNISVSKTAYAPSAFSRGLQPGALVPAEPGERNHGMAIPGALSSEQAQKLSAPAQGVISLLRECWRRMGLMKLSFAHAERSDGAGSRKRSAERRRDEDDWSRMEDEGCPNEGSQPIAGAVELSRKELVTHVG